MKPTNESVKAFILDVLSSGKTTVDKLEMEVEDAFSVIQEPLDFLQFYECYRSLRDEGKLIDDCVEGQPEFEVSCWIAPQKPVPPKPARNLFE